MCRILYPARCYAPRASGTRIPRDGFFSGRTGPRNNEITSARSPAGCLKLALLCLVPRIPPRSGGLEKGRASRRGWFSNYSSSCPSGRNKNGRAARFLPANTFIQRGFSRALASAWINEDFICLRILFLPPKHVASALCSQSIGRDYRFSSIDNCKDLSEGTFIPLAPLLTSLKVGAATNDHP